MEEVGRVLPGLDAASLASPVVQGLRRSAGRSVLVSCFDARKTAFSRTLLGGSQLVFQGVLSLRTLVDCSWNRSVGDPLFSRWRKGAPRRKARFLCSNLDLNLDLGRIFRHISHHPLRHLLALTLLAKSTVSASLAIGPISFLYFR